MGNFVAAKSAATGRLRSVRVIPQVHIVDDGGVRPGSVFSEPLRFVCRCAASKEEHEMELRNRADMAPIMILEEALSAKRPIYLERGRPDGRVDC